MSRDGCDGKYLNSPPSRSQTIIDILPTYCNNHTPVVKTAMTEHVSLKKTMNYSGYVIQPQTK